MPKKKQNKKLIYIPDDLLDTWKKLENKSEFVQMYLRLLKEANES